MTWQGGWAMAFRRLTGPQLPLEGEALTAAMVGIGMVCAAEAAPHPNIEDTLLAASIAGMEQGDLRVLAVLITWLEIHATWINADRLTTLVSQQPGERVWAYWGAVGHWLGKDRRFARLAKAHGGPRLDLLTAGTDFHLRRSGEDPRFLGGPLQVPAGMLRNRKGDVLAPRELARRHGAYRRRILLGPSYRADMWAELDRDPGCTAAELARRAYGSFATAWRVKRDWELVAETAQAW
jgi:hypothetical protein